MRSPGALPSASRQTEAAAGAGARDDFTPEERALLDTVEDFLADGLALKRWWSEASPTRRFAQRFDLTRVFNRAEDSYGFFDEVPLRNGPMRVMGNYQEMLYDQPRTPTRLQRDAATWMREQIRQFALRYFMRVADFRQPEAYVDQVAIPVPPFLGRLSWCPREDLARVGFGFSQVFYKLRATGEVGRFAADEEHAIVDVRDLGELYEWIVLKVRIFDFRFSLQPFGQEAPEFSVPLKEESYLVASRDFVVDEKDPAPGVLGEYGMGYAFVKSPSTGLLAYGPGDFDAAIELIHFRVLESGEVRVEMVFVAGRPERITNIYLDPLGWTLRVADVFSLGVAAPVLDPLRSVVARLPLRVGPFDPVYGWVAVANALTGGQAARQWCISREQLEKDFLVRHYMQHYQTMVGSLLTWRHIPDWLDEARLPEWVVKGTSS